MNRDELIEHLREEIAKRDMRIGELENDASYYAARNEELRSELATPTPIPDAAPVQQVSVPETYGLPPLPWSLRKCNHIYEDYPESLGGKPGFKPVYLEPFGLCIGQTHLDWPLADFILACVNSAASAQQVSVPVEPTIEMAEALYFDGKDYTHSKDFDDFKAAWPQMLLVARKLKE